MITLTQDIHKTRSHPRPRQDPTAHQHPALPGGRSLFVDAIIPSPEKSCGSSVYSPVFSPRDSGYPRFVTPELALPELSVPERAPPPVTGLPAPPHCHYSHSHSLANNPRSLELDERKRTKESRKSPAHHKDAALHKLGRTATTTRPPLSSKLRQNGIITAQKLPVLTNKSNSSSRVNLPHETSSRTGHNASSDGDTGGGGGGGTGGVGGTTGGGGGGGGGTGGGGGGGAGSLPVLNNNKGENSNESPHPRRLPSSTRASCHPAADANGHTLPFTPQASTHQTLFLIHTHHSTPNSFFHPQHTPHHSFPHPLPTLHSKLISSSTQPFHTKVIPHPHSHTFPHPHNPPSFPHPH
nr:aspartate, glycine, lysine and serine-rich protein-like [Penaeus vannamei]